MIRAEQIPIPPEARMAATAELLRTGGDVVAAIRAALNAWPGVEVVKWYYADQTLILPLPQEPRDE